MEPEPHPLTPEAQKLLDILRSSYGWMSRATLAAKLKQKQLYPSNVFMLKRLERRKLIESRKAQSGPNNYRIYEYRFIEPEERNTHNAN